MFELIQTGATGSENCYYARTTIAGKIGLKWKARSPEEKSLHVGKSAHEKCEDTELPCAIFEASRTHPRIVLVATMVVVIVIRQSGGKSSSCKSSSKGQGPSSTGHIARWNTKRLGDNRFMGR